MLAGYIGKIAERLSSNISINWGKVMISKKLKEKSLATASDESAAGRKPYRNLTGPSGIGETIRKIEEHGENLC